MYICYEHSMYILHIHGYVTASPIRKDPTTSIGKHAKELKVHEKSVRLANKQNLHPDFIKILVRFGLLLMRNGINV